MSEAAPFDEKYPYVAGWVRDGWIEIGRDDYSSSFVRVLDVGGMIWEGAESYETVDEALAAAEVGIREWLEGHG